MKLKIGDIVIIKEHPLWKCKEKSCRFLIVEEMRNFIGKQARIINIDVWDESYRIDIDEGRWAWSDCMLKKVKSKPAEVELSKKSNLGRVIKLLEQILAELKKNSPVKNYPGPTN